MKAFLSWAGERSRQAALALQTFLNDLFPAESKERFAWMSDKDIYAGERWRESLGAGLQAELGILCLTPESADKPWILFEAGVLSNTVRAETRVVPYLLFGLQPKDLRDPLRQFDAVTADCDGTFELLRSVNSLLPAEKRSSEQKLKARFAQTWPKLAISLRRAQDKPSKPWHTIFEPNLQPSYDHDLRNASEIWLIGVSLVDTLTTYQSDLKDLLRAECKFRILLSSPESCVLEGATLRKSTGRQAVQKGIKQKEAEIENSKIALRQIAWGVAHSRKNLYIRETRYPLAYGAHAMNPSKPSGVLYVKLYPYRVRSKPKPILVLRANRDQAYEYFQRELLALWEGGRKLSL